MNRHIHKQYRNPARLMNILLYMLSFLVPAIGMVLIMKARGFYPFKDTTMFVMDMHDQYLEFFASLRYLFTGENSLFFSWSHSMGGNFIGLFAYYVANPLSFITAFFPLQHMPMAIVVLSVLKIGLCGLSFSIYASYLWQREQTSPSIAPLWAKLVIIPFSTAYALMSYNIIYLLCLMWLDGVILLPWILLGVEKLLDGKKGISYMLALTALFYCNFYTGYMVGLFTALYVVFRILIRFTPNMLKKYFFDLIRFTAATLFALGLSAPLLLPVIKNLMKGRLTYSYTTTTPYTFQPFSLLFRQYTNGAYQSLDDRGLPPIYCGYIVLAFALLFFLLRKISLREKIGAFCIILILSLSFYCQGLNSIWHIFQNPVGFPFRYAFLFGFFLVYMAVRAIICLPWTKLPTIWQRKPVYELIVAILMLVTAADMGTNGRDILFAIGNQFAYDTVEKYETFLNSTKPLIDSIKQNDNGLYRINQAYEYSKNDAMLLGYNGMVHYSSTYNPTVNLLTAKLGLAQIHFWNSGYGSNPLLDSLFSVKYVLDDYPVPEFYTKFEETNVIWEEEAQVTTSYRNDSTLPMVYSAPVTTLSPDISSDDPYENQNILLNSIADTENAYFTKYDCTATAHDTGWTYIFTAASSNPVYMYLPTNEYTYSPQTVYVNGTPVGGYFSHETVCSLYLGSFNAGQQVIVEIPEQTIIPNAVLIGELHINLLADTLAQLRAGGMDIDTHRGGRFSGSITVPEGSMILTSIPYDEGWIVKIDGEKIKTEKFADTFLAVPAESGKHTIEFSYVSPGFWAGIFLCFTTLILCTIYFLYPAGRSKKYH